MIALFTDFGWNGPYVGQMKSVLYKMSPTMPVVDLMHDAPVYNPRASAYLLASLVNNFPKDTVFLCIVDPGVGNRERKPVVMKTEKYWFVGPENGLFNVLAMRANDLEYWDITWEPENLSSTFHGRDLFAPVAALLANNKMYNLRQEYNLEERINYSWEEDLSEIIYIDHYGNCITGIRASTIAQDSKISVANLVLDRQKTFSSVPVDGAFWFENSSGLVEIAINKSSFSKKYKLVEGNSVCVVK